MRLEGKGLFHGERAKPCKAYLQGHQEVQKQLQYRDLKGDKPAE